MIHFKTRSTLLNQAGLSVQPIFFWYSTRSNAKSDLFSLSRRPVLLCGCVDKQRWCLLLPCDPLFFRYDAQHRTSEHHFDMVKLMIVLGIILARAGSKGLPNKCMRDLCGQPVIGYTFDHAKKANGLSDVILSTDCEPAKDLARSVGIAVVDRPSALASDTATVDDAARHAVESWEQDRDIAVDTVVLLYGNIPVRAVGVIDRAIEHLKTSGADSVRTVALVGKQHPDWLHRLNDDKMTSYRPNSIYRRQDLEPLYYHDGAVVVVTRAALFEAVLTPDDHQAFLGSHRCAIVQSCEDTVDIDEPIDLYLAEAMIRNSTRASQECV